MIMEVFGLKPSREVGQIKLSIREAMLDGVIPNEFDLAFEFMLEEGRKLGFRPIKDKETIRAIIPPPEPKVPPIA